MTVNLDDASASLDEAPKAVGEKAPKAVNTADPSLDSMSIPMYYLQSSVLETRFAMTMAACCNMSRHIEDGKTLGDDWVVVAWAAGGMSTLCADCAYDLLAKPQDFQILFGPGVRAQEPPAPPPIAEDLVGEWMKRIDAEENN